MIPLPRGNSHKIHVKRVNTDAYATYLPKQQLVRDFYTSSRITYVVALLIVLFMPALGRAFGFSDRLQRMSDEVAQRYGLPLAEMREHQFAVPADGAESSLLEEAECPVCLESGSRSWSALMHGRGGGRGCGHKTPTLMW